MPYRTRIVVRRPASSTKFTGVVVVDRTRCEGGPWGRARVDQCRPRR
jgi:hypothetical protein